MSIASCSTQADYKIETTVNPNMLTDFERKIAQKMALDIRYFCENPLKAGVHCQQAVTKLPDALKTLIRKNDIGGVVLFAENLVSTSQIIQLTDDLQSAALTSKSAKPLFISIDQEGGRVVRFPKATTFMGNMAIGATYPSQGTKFARVVGETIGSELNALGLNNNYAPVIDVNTNANNPVINTRSFGENPQQVAELGVAMVNAFQKNNVMATLKHFPGHGDTHVDSHLGLPRVNHDIATIEKVDIAPFKWAIMHSQPAMIMTAHIQYPALDNTTIINKMGEATIRPATMSREIITHLLREKMNYTGIIASDALDMAGIAHYFDEVTAAVETLSAGVDLTLMPFKVRSPADVEKFTAFVKKVSQGLLNKVANGQLSLSEIDQSLARLNKAKEQYIKVNKSAITKKVIQANNMIASEKHLDNQQKLADEATILLNTSEHALPILPSHIKHIHLLVATEQEQQALQKAITKQWQLAGQTKLLITSIVAEQDNALARIQNQSELAQADLVISTIDVKIVSAVDLGGVEDLVNQAINNKKAGKNAPKAVKANYGQLVQLQLTLAKKQGIKSVLIAQGSPYLLRPYTSLADASFIIFEDMIFKNQQDQYESAGMNTSLAIIVGQQLANGVLPVTLAM